MNEWINEWPFIPIHTDMLHRDGVTLKLNAYNEIDIGVSLIECVCLTPA